MRNEKLYDAVVIGGGPAGLTAALYLARARYRVLVIEREQFGGQITITSEVVNYPGVGLASGAELTETMRQQAEDFGAEFMSAEVTSLVPEGDIKTVHTTKGELQCFGIIIATGAHPRMIGFEGEAEFRGHGVAYCATCDGEFFTGKEIFVVGGGFAAAEESVFLTKYAKHVTILVREEDFTCAKAVADEARNHPKISVLYETEVESVSGDTALRSIRYRNNKTGEVTEHHAEEGDTFGVFVFAGYEPETALVRDIVKLNEYGYVVTDNNRKTDIEGLYAAGDICEKNLRQVVTAVSDGAIAATELEKYAAAMQKKTGIIPEIPMRVNAEKPTQESTQSGSGFFSTEVCAQLDSVFSKMERCLVLKLYLDEQPLSEELKEYMEAMAERTDKLSVQIAENAESEEFRPCVRICQADGTETGLAFHGVPGGHEFSSFVLGLYNAAGPGQPIDAQDKADIARITKPLEIQVLVTLSCTMCPELVTAVQKIAAENPHVTAEVYDVNHFPKLRQQYQVMSVPCLVANGETVSFGKKNLRQVLDLIV
ncbi:MAG: FAD-dependent oxidoreductase [Oscillospiraceae bacterium]|nr:FAD-dependent oxidoreductase [Oscillospiraceae bacterium]